MITALAERDSGALRAVMAEDVDFRALLPSRVVGADNATGAAAEMVGWFDDVPRIVLGRADVDTVGDLWHAAYRLELHGMDVPRIVEDQAYCVVVDGRIQRLRLMCSGFRPVGVPAADQRIDALGDGCATLTPRIAAAMRAMAAGDVLGVLTDDPAAAEGIAAWSRLTGHEVITATPEAAGTRFYLKHR